MKKLLVLLISVLIIFSVIPFSASATELNLPETTPLIVKEAILNGDITGTTPIRNLQICDKIYNAFKNFETTVDLSEFRIFWSDEGKAVINNCLLYVIDLPEMSQIYKYLDLENCSLKKLYINGTPYFTEIVFSYLPNTTNGIFDKELALSQVNEYEELVSEIIDTMPKNISNLEKLIYLHDYLAVNYEYTPNGEAYIYNSYDFLKNKRGVCDAYSRTYLYLLKKAGIPAMRALSDEGNHSWNIVSLDGEYYHVDVTWADPVPNREGMVSHEYFLLSDNALTSLDNTSHINWYVQEADVFSLNNFHCTSTKFDNGYVWDNTDKKFCFYNGEYYYIENTSCYRYETINGNRYLTDYEISAEIKKTTDFKTAVTVKKVYSELWFDKNGTGYYIPDFHSGLHIVDNQIYFNDSKSIKYYDLQSGEIGTVLSVRNSNITGFNYVGNGTFNYTEFSVTGNSVNYTKKTFALANFGNLLNKTASFTEVLVSMRKYISDGKSLGLCLINGDISGNDGKVDVRDLVALKKLAVM